MWISGLEKMAGAATTSLLSSLTGGLEMTVPVTCASKTKEYSVVLYYQLKKYFIIKITLQEVK